MGLSLFAYFHQNPHLVPDGQTIYANADQLFPHFIVFGLPGTMLTKNVSPKTTTPTNTPPTGCPRRKGALRNPG